MLCPKPTERLFPTPPPVSKKTKSSKTPAQRTATDWRVLTEVKFYPPFCYGFFYVDCRLSPTPLGARISPPLRRRI